MPLKTSRLDLARLLETEEDIQEFLEETAREGTPGDLVHALDTAARARGMTEVARQAGVTRASLYKSLGVLYVLGVSVTQNDAEAIKWFRKAAEQGNDEARKALEKMSPH